MLGIRNVSQDCIEVTYNQDIIIANVIVINIDNVVNTAHFENFLQRWIFMQ